MTYGERDSYFCWVFLYQMRRKVRHRCAKVSISTVCTRRWVGVDVQHVCLRWFVCLSVRLREARLMLKLCAYKGSCSILHYLSHAQKILPQTVMVSRPYLRLPWRFLHPQVGKTHSPIMCPRMCPSRVGLVCHHVLCFFFFCSLNVWMFWSHVYLVQVAQHTMHKDIKITYSAHIHIHAFASSIPAFSLMACMQFYLHHCVSIWGGRALLNLLLVITYLRLAAGIS